MNILCLTDYLGNIGGAELSAQTIVNGLARNDEIDTIRLIGVDLSTVERLDFPGVDVVPLSVPSVVDKSPDLLGDIIIGYALSKEAEKYVEEADVIHAHHRRSSFALSHLSTATPKVATVRDYWPICPISIYPINENQYAGSDQHIQECLSYQGWDNWTEPVVRHYLWWKLRFNRQRFEDIDHPIFIANHLQSTIKNVVDISRSSVIYNPVSVPIPPNVRDNGAESPVFVTASSLTREKGIDTAIESMAKLCEHYPESRLIIFGDGKQRDELERQATKVGKEKISFRGHAKSTEVYDTIRQATATIFPSKWNEPFGRVSVESMMLGTPVVGSNVGGIAEIITHEETGLLFEAGDVRSLTNQLLRLIGSPDLWQRLSQQGIRESDIYKPKSIVQSHVELYHSLVN